MSKLMKLADAYAYALGNSYAGSSPEARAALQAEVKKVELDAARYGYLRS